MLATLRSARLPIVGALIAMFMALPALVVVPMSFTKQIYLQWPPSGFTWRWYNELFTDPMWRDATIASLKVGGMVTVLATVVGTMMALGLVRGRFAGRSLVNIFVVSPMIVPAVILAIGIYFFYARIHLIGSIYGLVFAHTLLALPLVVISVSNSLRNVDRNLERAAQNLGAGPIRTFFRVTLPLIMPGVVAGALFAFITSWDEIVIALFMTTSDFRTLPVVMFTEIQETIRPTVAAAGTLLIATTTVILVLALGLQRLVKRRRASV